MAKKKEVVKTEARPVGRPTDFKEEYTQKLIDYFSVKPYEEINGKLVASDIPTLAGFACLIGQHRETLRNWCEQSPEFFAAFQKAKEFQENWLAVNGNKGLINPAFGIFTAKNVTTWRDKREMELSGGLSNITDEEIDRKLAELESKS